MISYKKQCKCNAGAQTGNIIMEQQYKGNDNVVAYAMVYHPEPVCISCNTPWIPDQTSANTKQKPMELISPQDPLGMFHWNDKMKFTGVRLDDHPIIPPSIED